MAAYVYVMTNGPHGILYVGVTSDMARRAWEHREGTIEGFTSKYGLKRLVFVERHEEVTAAIRPERTMKTWRRAWKVRLIEAANPEWDDLAGTRCLTLKGVDGRPSPTMTASGADAARRARRQGRSFLKKRTKKLFSSRDVF